MNETILQAKIAEYAPQNALEQENVLHELLQHFILASLSRAAFFDVAVFHGGTCLRMLHAMPRFSEGLDFVLKQPDPQFQWQPFAEKVVRELNSDGITVEFRDRSVAHTTVKKAFLKTDSVGKVILLRLPYSRDPRRKIMIKLEVDIRPPEGSEFDTGFLTFPFPVAVTKQTLSSSFASKSHALLCRGYTKGRDWYDFLWYAAKSTPINYALLLHALVQQGPWQGKRLKVDHRWYVAKMATQIKTIDWREAVEDVRRFLPHSEQAGLDAWSAKLFLSVLERWDAGTTA